MLLPILFLPILFLQGCAPELPSGENVRPTPIAIPKIFPEPKDKIALPLLEESKTINPSASINNKHLKVSLNNEEWADKKWSKFFTDSDLSNLIKTALHNNQQLNIIQQDINISRNEIMARKGEYLPKLGVGAGYEIEKVGDFTSQGANDATAEYVPNKFVPKRLHNREIGLFATWEVDIWHKLRNAAKSAYYKYLSTAEAKNFMATQLIAEIATKYYELMVLDKQLEIVQIYVGNLTQVLEMVKAQQFAARATSLAVKRFEAEVLKNQSRQYVLQQKIITTENNINYLVGRFPQPVKRHAILLDNKSPENINVGVPAKLLNNRPDIKQASLDLKAAKLDVKVAKARFYPSLSVNANLGQESFNSKHFLDSPQSMFYNLAANISAPLLNRMAIKADYFSANNKQISAIYNYELTLVKAYSEVANQLAKVNNLEKIYTIKFRQVDALNESVDISNLLFKAARIDYIESLLTQRDSLKAQIELAEVKKQQLIAHVNLYRSLGGGWRKK